MGMKSDAKRAGITFDGYQFWRCDECGTEWSPNIKSGGGYHRGWRLCPNGCNADRLSHKARAEHVRVVLKNLPDAGGAP